MKLNKSKLIALLLSLAALLAVTVGSTLAYLATSTAPLENKFDPAQVSCVVNETFNGTQKTDVSVKNTSDIPAYIRAAVIVTWTDASGNISAKSPVLVTDYTMTLAENSGWVINGNYYYYTSPVAAGESTGILISSIIDTETVNEGYELTVEIVAEAIQSQPETAVKAAWGFVPGATTN